MSIQQTKPTAVEFMELRCPAYADGQLVKAGDILCPGVSVDGQVIVVVYVAATREAVPEFDASAWAQLQTGVVVEHCLSGMRHLVYYPTIDSDMQLLSRKKQQEVTTRTPSAPGEAGAI